MASTANPTPPARDTNGITRHDPPAYNTPPADPSVEYTIFVYRPGAGQRFLGAFFVATFIWILFGMLVRSSMYVMHGRMRYGLGRSNNPEYSIPTGIHLGQCIQGSAWTPFLNSTTPDFQQPSSLSMGNSAIDLDERWVWGYTSYDLPVSSESLLLLSRGQNLVGTIELETSPRQPRDYAMVRILMSSTKREALESTKACMVTRGVNETGVGIFTPTTWLSGDFPGSNGSHFRITVTLPEFSHPSPLYIKNFETDVPGTAHIVQDINNKVLFDRISLIGSVGFVNVKSLRANMVNISTTDATITGRFNVTKVISLSGKYSPMKVDVDLTRREGEINSTFTAASKSGAIHANIRLFSTSLSPGSFYVTANSSGRPVQIKIPVLPPAGSELHVKASTSRALASVLLPPAYEGNFDLQTDYGKPIVQIDPDIEDPSHLGRRRRIVFESIGDGAVSGYVDWGGLRGKGSVSVRSSILHYLTGTLLEG